MNDLETTERLRVRALAWGWVALGYALATALAMWLSRHTRYDLLWSLLLVPSLLGAGYYFTRATYLGTTLHRARAQAWRDGAVTIRSTSTTAEEGEAR